MDPSLTPFSADAGALIGLIAVLLGGTALVSLLVGYSAGRRSAQAGSGTASPQSAPPTSTTAEELAFARGRETGAKEAMKQFVVKYEPFVVVEDGYFSAEVESGYSMQLHVHGMPVGDPMRRVTQRHKKVDKDRIDAVLQLAQEAMVPLIQMATQAQIGVAVSPPRRISKADLK